MATIFKTKVEILRILSDIKSGKIVPRKFTGICENVREHACSSMYVDTLIILKNIFKEWLISKSLEVTILNTTFPVENSRLYYIDAEKGTLWDNPIRWELIDFMIKYLQKGLDLNKPL